jgi:hypothetical protein
MKVSDHKKEGCGNEGPTNLSNIKPAGEGKKKVTSPKNSPPRAKSPSEHSNHSDKNSDKLKSGKKKGEKAKKSEK